MGFDLIGRYPVSEEGSYFRMNQFMWPPFVDLLHDICARDILHKCRLWYSSDEDGLDEKHALALAKDLQNRIEDGSVEKALERRRYDFASYQIRAKRRGGRHARDARQPGGHRVSPCRSATQSRSEQQRDRIRGHPHHPRACGAIRRIPQRLWRLPHLLARRCSPQFRTVPSGAVLFPSATSLTGAATSFRNQFVRLGSGAS
jgi:hypothetical protein